MAERKSTWYLLGIASGGDDSAAGFQLGWQYGGYADIVSRINYTSWIWTSEGAGSLRLNREGTVSIENDIKESHEGLMEVGVIFVFQWNNPKMALGGKFDWIGRGEDGGEMHDVNSQNIVSKLEDPVGVTKKQNYWFQNGAKPGPLVVSNLLKRTSGTGGVIVTVGRNLFCKAYSWAAIGRG